MPQDPSKHGNALTKKQRRQEARAGRHQPAIGQLSAEGIVERGRTLPILECLINVGWDHGEMGLVQVVVTREQSSGHVVFASYLVDVYCLGVKDTLWKAGYSRAHYDREKAERLFARMGGYTVCPPELAHQMVYQAIDYAARFGFRPQADFAISEYLLEPRGTFAEPYALTFGKDGQPLFIAGTHDDAKAIVAQLERTAGPGNYHYIVSFGGPPDEFV